MIDESDNPNPDELLKEIQKQESQEKLGSLKIFFGMSAGVGKTYSMLEKAQKKQKEGVKVVVGTINTHGRKETEALLQGLIIIPEKWIKYKDIVFEEMDLETLLNLKPELVLVDELAHTNVPGAKHPKRWQDVIELLDSGINVYTTLNVQHLESRKDIVESLTGIEIRETVPDLILERANTIELIDIPPSELLQRLHEGKVYAGDASKRAAEHFFQEGNLTALREIALRFTAEKVDHDLHGILQGKGWKTRERLMVAINSDPSSEQYIRSARRLSFELDAPWIAVYVDTGATLNDQDQIRLNRNFNLAQELGAEVITTYDLDIAAGLKKIAKQKDVTRIVIGRSSKKKFSIWEFFQGSFIERLENENREIDIIILRQEKLTQIYQRTFPAYEFSSKWRSYGIALAFIAGITAFGWLIMPFIGYKSVGFIFLLGILSLSFFVGTAPIFFAAILSTVSWDLFFIPPLTGPTISNPEDLILVIIYFFVATIMGILTSRMREQDQFFHKREERIERLYEIEQEISNSTNLEYLRLNINTRLGSLFPGKFDILMKGLDNKLIIDSQDPFLNMEKERAAAFWVFQSGKIGGWSTDTLPSAKGIYFPIVFSKSKVGVLVYQPQREQALSNEETNFIQTVAQQLGGYLERYTFEDRMRKQDYTGQVERMHRSIFHSLNRSFYTQLDKIITINHEIQKENTDSHISSLVNEMEQFIFNIKFTVDNIIAISELESGFTHIDLKKNSIKDLIDQSLQEIKPLEKESSVKVQLPLSPQPIFLPFDFNLLKLALINLLLNAFEYSNFSKPVLIKLNIEQDDFCLSVIDEGPGIPEEILPFIFNKFYRDPIASKGLGLGLAVVKAVVDIHQGKIKVKNRDQGGTEFCLILPL
jgi:two-component system, OmpR family, sensor histidine kinase KdpD